MSVVEAHARSLSDADLLAMAARNLVTSQARVFAAEVERRGLGGTTRADCLAAGHTLTHVKGAQLGLLHDRWVCDTDGARYPVTAEDRERLEQAR